MDKKIKRILSVVLNVAYTVMLSGFIIIVLYLVLKIFFFESYPVNSMSMIPTIVPGDRIMVNKQLLGPRLYRNLDFFNGERLDARRLKGFRDIGYDDIVVFNHSPEEKWRDHLEFSINTIYVKRCIGMPGDTIRISNGIYFNSALGDTVGLRTTQLRDQLRPSDPRTERCLPFDKNFGWTIKEFGPFYIPVRGDTLDLTPANIKLYKKYIDYENNSVSTVTDRGLLIDGTETDRYVFGENYYFMAGDNIADSRDSRYFGLVPEQFIVGIATNILYSRDPYSGMKNKDRRLKKLK